MYVSPRHGRRDAADDPTRPHAGVDRHHPALALFRGAPAQPAGLVSNRRVDLRAGLRGGGARADAGRHTIQAVADRSSSPRYSLFGVDALALHHRRRLRGRSRSRGRSADCCRWSRSPGQTPPACEVRRDVFTGGPLELSRSRLWSLQRGTDLEGRAIKEVELVRIQDEHYYVVRLDRRRRTPDGTRASGFISRTTSPDARRRSDCWSPPTRSTYAASLSASTR